MAVFLNSFNPLVRFPSGRRAIAEHQLPPFVDYSCRREPDFESNYPSISALCRIDKLVSRVHPGDIVVYLTNKDRCLGVEPGHRRLVAILAVLERFESHTQAAVWYQARGERLPVNCMVAGNPPLVIDRTAPITEFKSDLRRWDLEYHRRARRCGIFLACTARYLELHNPPIVIDDMLRTAFGRVPGTQNPPEVSVEALAALRQLCRV